MVPPPPDREHGPPTDWMAADGRTERRPQSAYEISVEAELYSIQKRLTGMFERLEVLEKFEAAIVELVCRMAGKGTSKGITEEIGNVVVDGVVFSIRLKSGNSGVWRIGWTIVGGIIVAALGNILGRVRWPL